MAQEELVVSIIGKDKLSGVFSKLTGSLGNFGKLAGGVALGGVVALTGAVAAFGASAVKEGAAFTKSMSNVGAISGATGKEFEKLEAQAKQLGATTKFTAIEAADAMGFLAMAGFETTDILGAMPGVLDLAAASNLDLGRSADIVSNILSGFGEDASQTGKFVDVLTKTFTSSNTSLEQLGQAMKFVAPVADAFGFSVEDTSAALGTLGNAGIQAGVAGRGLRGVLSKLGAPTEAAAKGMEALGVEVFNLDGTMKTLPEIIGEFNTATADMTDQQKAAALGSIFSRGEISNMLVLMEAGQGTLQEFGDQLRDSGGTAAEIAAKQLDNLSGDVTLFQSALSGVKIEVFELLEPILRNIVQVGTQMLSSVVPAITAIIAKLSSFIPANVQEQIDAFLAALMLLGTTVMASILPSFDGAGASIQGFVAGILPALTSAILFVVENFELFKAAAIGIGAALAAASIVGIIVAIVAAINPLTIAIVAIGAAIGILSVAWTQNWGNIQAVVMTAWTVLQAVWAGILAALDPLITQVSSLGITWEQVFTALGTATAIVGAVIGAAILALIAVVVSLVAAIGAAVESIISTFTNLAAYFMVFVDGVLQLFEGNFSQGLTQIIVGLTGIIVTLITGALDLIISVVGTFITSIIAFFQGMYDALVGGSIITDLTTQAAQLFQTMIDTITGAVSSFVGSIKSQFSSMASGIKSAISSVSSAISSLVSKLSSISLPSFLTPGSPTPFELGLLGISDALRTTTAQVKSLDTAMGSMGVGGMSAGSGGIGGDSATNNNDNRQFNMTVNTNAPQENIVQDFAVLSALTSSAG